MKTINPAAIPQELRDKAQWVVWKYETRDGKMTKVPYKPGAGKASVKNPRTWSSFERVVSALEKSKKFDGIGYVFNDEEIGLDLDHAVENATLKPWARAIVESCATYKEFSPSGNGIHAISRGRLPGKGCKRKYEDGAVELYSTGRYFTFTGNIIPGSPDSLHDDSRFLIDLYKRLNGASGNGTQPKKQSVASDTLIGGTVDSSQRLEVALRDPVFSRLWHGDTSGNSDDDSAADLALCNKLAFYFDRDPAQIDSLFRRSGLMRDKWEDREDYRQWTIDKAIEGTTETYSPKRKHQKQGGTTGRGDASREPGGPPDEKNFDDRPIRYSEDALASEFSTREEQDLSYVPGWGWLEWTGQRWKRIPDVAVMEKARPICKSAARICREDESLKPSTREGLARSLSSAKTVAAVERLARGDHRHYSEVDSWDSNLWVFNATWGTLDLKTGHLYAHRREDKITKIANATPRGDCPRWLQFLGRVTGGDPELRDYLQRFAGYSLVGDPREESLEFCYGPGGNGKGTFIATLQYVFGDYATTAATSTFMESFGEKHPTDVAKLAGARLVVCNEVDEGQSWDEARIKNLTGRDTLTARFMRQDFFDFMPQFSLIIAGNNKPTLKTVDESIRRRFHLIPFSIVIPPEERDESLKEALRGEADGILAWAVEGCLAWQRQKLNPPESVLAATADYLKGQNTILMWLEDCAITGNPDDEELSSLLFESLKIWQHARGEQPLKIRTFSERMEKAGFPSRHSRQGAMYRGLRLADNCRDAAQAAIDDRKRGKKQEWWDRD